MDYDKDVLEYIKETQSTIEKQAQMLTDLMADYKSTLNAAVDSGNMTTSKAEELMKSAQENPSSIFSVLKYPEKTINFGTPVIKKTASANQLSDSSSYDSEEDAKLEALCNKYNIR
jgi:hypothetical protein